jgi:hypothetical protein
VKKNLGKRILVSTDRFDNGVVEGVGALTQSRVAKISAEAFDQVAVHDAGDRCSRSHLPAEQRAV